MLPVHSASAGTSSSRASGHSISAQSKIEENPAGYPRFAALTGSDQSFFLFRRFATLRARMLLAKQDQICELEIKLQHIDRDEQRIFNRATLRMDKNLDRKEVLKQLDVAMTDYDDLAQRTQQVLATKVAPARNIENLRQWFDGTGSIVRPETAYLTYKRDLMALGPTEADDFLQSLADRAEDALIWISERFGWSPANDFSSHPGIHIFSGNLIKIISRSILALLTSSFLLAPIAILSSVHNLGARIAVAMISNAIFIFVVSVLAKVKMGELFMAAAAYAAVMVVYISGTNT